MVDVCMITYNHESFIAQAIEGFLMQETSFPVRLVIGEDGSTDGTRAICLEYHKKYPDKIFLLPDEGNLGMNPNFLRTLKACDAKYVALCEGDDYWTNPHKLQKQVDFMEANPDFAICFHQMQVIYENDPSKNYITNQNQKEVTDIYDLARGNYIFTASCLFRNHLIIDFPDSFKTAPVGDYFLHMLNAKHGKIRFLNELMGVYRVHSGGAWENKPESYRHYKWINVLESIYPEMENSVRTIFDRVIEESINIVATSWLNGDFLDTEFKESNKTAFYKKIVELNADMTSLKIENENLQETILKYNNLRRQYNQDINRPFRTLLRNVYYKLTKKLL